MSPLNLNVIYTFQQHPIIRILLPYLPNEIISIIAFKFKAITPYPLYIANKELINNCIQWIREIRNETIYSIYFFRRNNNMDLNAFKFPRDDLPCINRTFRICNTRESQLKYQSLWARELVSNYNIPFGELRRSMILTMFIQLFNYDNYIIETLNSKEFIQEKTLEELIRAYYRFDMNIFLHYPNFSDYLNTIIHPWK